LSLSAALPASLTRRHALLALALPAALTGGCAGLPRPAAPWLPQRLADGVYWLPGSGGQPDAGNGGRVGNAGFIVGENGVLVIDTGGSLAQGRALLAAIRGVTPLPVRLALVTHARPEFLFGGNAFREAGIPIHMQRRTAQLMASRCETCLKALVQQLGTDAMAGTTMYTPDAVFDAPPLLLPLIGRAVRVIQRGHSSGPGDIAVLDGPSGVLFAGGLLDAGRIPDIQDSDLPGWHRVLAELAALQPTRVVPGHGPASPPALIGQVVRYLGQLEARSRALVAEGASLIDVPETTELPEFAGWDQYDSIHRRNASIAYLRFERQLLLRQETPP
jgi:glyoxylase-like metal-dependent hydrolase (beta-lactamase superfamily II)